MTVVSVSDLVAEFPDISADRAGQLAETITALVEGYAPAAPATIKREAGLRAAGWLYEAPPSGIREESAGPLSAGYSPAMTSCLRASGAMALLSPWKVRRAGAIG